jgi:hypothetical protein
MSCKNLLGYVQSSWGRIETYVRKCNRAMYTEQWLSGYAKRNALLGLLVSHIIALVPALPWESPTSRHCFTHVVFYYEDRTWLQVFQRGSFVTYSDLWPMKWEFMILQDEGNFVICCRNCKCARLESIERKELWAHLVLSLALDWGSLVSFTLRPH